MWGNTSVRLIQTTMIMYMKTGLTFHKYRYGCKEVGWREDFNTWLSPSAHLRTISPNWHQELIRNEASHLTLHVSLIKYEKAKGRRVAWVLHPLTTCQPVMNIQIPWTRSGWLMPLNAANTPHPPQLVLHPQPFQAAKPLFRTAVSVSRLLGINHANVIWRKFILWAAVHAREVIAFPLCTLLYNSFSLFYMQIAPIIGNSC